MDSVGCRWLLTGFSVLTGLDTFWGSACSQAPDAIWAFLSMYCTIITLFCKITDWPQYSNFGNKCPKLGVGTPEDMLLSSS